MVTIRRSLLTIAVFGSACTSSSTVEHSAAPRANENTSIVIPRNTAPARPPHPYNPTEILNADCAFPKFCR